MHKGKVKFFHPTKGYGFITPEVAGDDVAVNQNGLKDFIQAEDVVKYDLQGGFYGPEAVNVELIR